MAPPSNEQTNGYPVNAYEKSRAPRRQQRAEGPATILAIGTANPPTVYKTSEFSDWYFNITNSNHETELKAKMIRICKNDKPASSSHIVSLEIELGNKSGIEKRYLHLTDEILKKSPEIMSYAADSMNARQALGVDATPELGAEAAEKALQEWGRPRSLITHVVMAATCGIHIPGADLMMANILGLRPDVKRVMLYHQGCFAGGTTVRIAKDLAENNKGARVLVVNSEHIIECFRGPEPGNPEHGNATVIVGSVLFGDGAGALIIGADPVPNIEKPLFEIQASLEAFVPDTTGQLHVDLTQAGLYPFLSKDLPSLLAGKTGSIIKEALEFAGSPDVNDVFWCLHPGGKGILDAMEKVHALKPEKLEASRTSLREYGNMFSASVIFVLDEFRKRSKAQKKSTNGDGCEWGLLIGIGPGVTVECSVLKAMPTEF